VIARRLVLVAAAVVLSGGLLVAVTPGAALAAPNTFVTMPDGVSIAVNVRMPKGYKAGKKYPTIFEMSGYDGGSAEGQTLVVDYNLPRGLPLLSDDDSRQLTRMFEPQYVTIHASVRGSGCSSGEFDLFSWTSALDGKFIIDQWIPKQQWSNGDVAIMGHSYSGITGFMVAATQPTHLRAATVSGLIDDVYRGIVYPIGPSTRREARSRRGCCDPSGRKTRRTDRRRVPPTRRARTAQSSTTRSCRA
jgi:putative CocE/NonD family hydrolase